MTLELSWLSLLCLPPAHSQFQKMKKKPAAQVYYLLSAESVIMPW